jgi:hypothetical protein
MVYIETEQWNPFEQLLCVNKNNKFCVRSACLLARFVIIVILVIDFIYADVSFFNL